MTTLKDQLDSYKGILLTPSQIVDQRNKIKEDVKKAVLKFERVLNDAEKDGCINITTYDTRDVFRDIFGDFKK